MKFGIIGNNTKPSVKNVAAELMSYFRSHEIPCVIEDELGKMVQSADAAAKVAPSVVFSERELSRQCDILISLGGDGTLLSTARLAGSAGIPILGINLGRLGFIAEVSVTEMNDCIDDILGGRYFIEERLVILAKTTTDKREYHALNELVVDRAAALRIIELETYVNNEYLVTYAADGIIFTTPTGSTGYSLASGGPIVTPESKVITINPISPHTLTARPVIVPEGSVIRVIVHSSSTPAHIIADGQVEGFYDSPAEFIIHKAPYAVKLIKRNKQNYFDLLRRKLMWGRDVRIKDKE